MRFNVSLLFCTELSLFESLVCVAAIFSFSQRPENILGKSSIYQKCLHFQSLSVVHAKKRNKFMGLIELYVF